MEFWAAEVKSGEQLKVKPGNGMILHLSQANVGEVKKDKSSETVCLFVNVNGNKLVLGTLFCDKLPQQQFDLVFDKEFELSHNLKAGSVYFYGYRACCESPEESGPGSDSEASESENVSSESDDEEMEIPENIPENEKKLWENMIGKPLPGTSAPAKQEKPKANAGKQKVKIVEPAVSDDSDSEDEDDSDDSESEKEETPTPKKVKPGKKRGAAEASGSKTPVPEKKAKVSSTPQKTDGKKGSAHVATPHPAKQAGKTPGANKSPKSASGSISCGSCKKTFNSEGAMQSHTKAKHSGGK